VAVCRTLGLVELVRAGAGAGAGVGLAAAGAGVGFGAGLLAESFFLSSFAMSAPLRQLVWFEPPHLWSKPWAVDSVVPMSRWGARSCGVAAGCVAMHARLVACGSVCCG
jgi:hypothetical protein